MSVRFRWMTAAITAAGLLSALAPPAAAQVMKEENGSLDSLAFVSERLSAPQALDPVDDVQSSLEPEVRDGWAAFRLGASDRWKAHVDRRTGRIESAEGDGIPWVPGRGNGLDKSVLGGKARPDLSTLDTIARGFLPRVSRLLGVDARSLALSQGRSGQPADHVWFVDYDVTLDGLAVEGARVVFRVNNGNLIQFGSENLPHRNARVQAARLSREAALAALESYVGGFSGADSFLDAGSLRLLPAAETDKAAGEGFAFGRGRGLVTVWQLTFRRDGDNGTWRARVDAATGEILSFEDMNHYAQATGGAKLLGTATNLPMPFTNLSTGGFTNSAGVYNFTGGTVTSSLAGQYVRISDNCGAISLTANGTTGDFAFGTSTGTNCTTPGVGGAGNTHSARTQFYHLNRAKEQARGWLPSNTWLNDQLTANVNINLTCNAFWNGSTVNFYRSGGGCGNTGEIEGVSLHEYGHGLDSNDGSGSSPDNGTGETYGDWTAALGTHKSCVGAGLPDQQLRRLRRRLHGLHGRARHRLGQARLQHAAHGGQLHPDPVPHQLDRLRRPLQPRGPLRVLRLLRGAVGLRQPRPAEPRLRRRLDHRRPALVPLPLHRHAGLHLHHRHLAVDLQRLQHRLAVEDPAGRGRRRRQPGQRHAPRRRPLRRLQPPRHRLHHGRRRQRHLRRLRRARRAGAHPHPRRQPGDGRLRGHGRGATSTATSWAATPASSRSATTSRRASPTPRWPTASPTTTRRPPTRAATRPAPRRPAPASR